MDSAVREKVASAIFCGLVQVRGLSKCREMAELAYVLADRIISAGHTTELEKMRAEIESLKKQVSDMQSVMHLRFGKRCGALPGELSVGIPYDEKTVEKLRRFKKEELCDRLQQVDYSLLFGGEQ